MLGTNTFPVTLMSDAFATAQVKIGTPVRLRVMRVDDLVLAVVAARKRELRVERENGTVVSSAGVSRSAMERLDKLVYNDTLRLVRPPR